MIAMGYFEMPKTIGKIPYFELRIHEKLGLQALINYLEEFMWVNIELRWIKG